MGINEKGLMVSVLTKPLPDDDIMAIFSYVSYKKTQEISYIPLKIYQFSYMTVEISSFLI